MCVCVLNRMHPVIPRDNWIPGDSDFNLLALSSEIYLNQFIWGG